MPLVKNLDSNLLTKVLDKVVGPFHKERPLSVELINLNFMSWDTVLPWTKISLQKKELRRVKSLGCDRFKGNDITVSVLIAIGRHRKSPTCNYH